MKTSVQTCFRHCRRIPQARGEEAFRIVRIVNARARAITVIGSRGARCTTRPIVRLFRLSIVAVATDDCDERAEISREARVPCARMGGSRRIAFRIVYLFICLR